ncbi:hypothetical protein R3W88_007528 [Solanum pinnatisectum]|uniref:Maturase K n=1 Tax=Solanum pinnatisectum TaxID=50273 RepID=A0AAV9M5W7_9SOLN|nr:hypothetical protein R3W88_007528 [Solanum pinnatisectum]
MTKVHDHFPHNFKYAFRKNHMLSFFIKSNRMLRECGDVHIYYKILNIIN